MSSFLDSEAAGVLPDAPWAGGGSNRAAAGRAAKAPVPPPLPSRPAVGAEGERILAALDVALPRAELPPGYGWAMGLLTAWLALIPLAYLALLAFLGWLVVWHALQALATLWEGPYFLFHLPMAMLGGLLLLFLVKPVFFRRKGKAPPVVALREADEPLLFAFVGKLCAASGAKAPTLIEVDCEPNAAARFHGGFGSLFGGELVLRIGLPLAAALPVRQFAGILAHELGHFNQRTGMAGSYLIRRLTFFFAQIVFQRDRLDEKLAALRRHNAPAARGLYWLAVGLIEPARGVLWLMLIGGELLTCAVLRRMEFDADRAEACVTGARDFSRTSRLLVFLHLASRRARNDLSETWEQQRLADDLPALIVANAKQLAEHRDDIFKMVREQKTGWLDTHPCDNERVAFVEALAAEEPGGAVAEGLVRCDVAAKRLFADFGALCRAATASFYQSVLDEAARGAKLVPTKEVVEQRSGERESFKALRRFFRGRVSALRPVLPGPDAFLPPEKPVEAVRALPAARQAMLEAAAAAAGVVEQLEEAAPAMAVARAQVALSGVFFGVPKAARMRADAARALQLHEPRYADAMRRLPALEWAAGRRLTEALRLLQCDAVSARLPGGAAARRSAAQLLAVCQALQPCLPAVLRLRELAVEVRVLFPSFNPAQPHPPLVQRVLEATHAAVGLLNTLRGDLAMAPYPFEHAAEGVCIGAALVQRVPDPRDPPDTFVAVMGVVDRFYTLLFRALAKLTDLAERVETLAGLEVLPEPAEKSEKDEQEAKAEADRASRDTRRHWLGYGARAAAGVTMLSVLLWLSASPPTFSVPWGHESGAAYRPNAFRVSFHESTPPPPYNPTGPTWPNGPTGPTSPYAPASPWALPGPRTPATPHTPRSPYTPGFPAAPTGAPTPQPPQTPGGDPPTSPVLPVRPSPYQPYRPPPDVPHTPPPMPHLPPPAPHPAPAIPRPPGWGGTGSGSGGGTGGGTGGYHGGGGRH